MAIPPAGTGSDSGVRKLLKENDALGGVSQEYYDSLKDRRVAADAIVGLLEKNFPESIHADIFESVGIDPVFVLTRRPRDPAFREEILRAYQYRCAICGFNARLGSVLVGVEAAHIKWHQAGGPDTNPNGVALCALHHKLFDRGMIGFTEEHRIIVSEAATGSAMFEHLVTAFHGKALSSPQRGAYKPDAEYVAWHIREVFHPPAREGVSA